METNYTFTAATMTAKGQVYPVQYSTSSRAVIVFVMNATGQNVATISIDENHPCYNDAMKAAKEAAAAWRQIRNNGTAPAADPVAADAAIEAAADPAPVAAAAETETETEAAPAADPAPVADPVADPAPVAADPAPVADPVADPAPAADPSAAAAAPRFTTKSIILADGQRIRIKYAQQENGTLILTGTADGGKPFTMTIEPSDDSYAAARAAYDEKAAKRAAWEADRAAEAAEGTADNVKYYAGMEIKGKGWTILMDNSIDRATITFKRRPSAAIREMVKAAGFWWSPNHQQWTRRLNNKAWQAAQELAIQLKGGKVPAPEAEAV